MQLFQLHRGALLARTLNGLRAVGPCCAAAKRGRISSKPIKRRQKPSFDDEDEDDEVGERPCMLAKHYRCCMHACVGR